jgi:hypothetical protein
MTLATALGSLAGSVDLWSLAEIAVPVIAALAGIAGAWLQAAHPPAAPYEHDSALLALFVV